MPFRRIYIYNKGPGKPNTTLPHVEIRLPNIGRCDHTYLYHIIEHYDSLAPVTIFTTGSADLWYKKEQLAFTVSKVIETNTSVFYGDRYKNVAAELYDFSMETYRSSHENNKDVDTAKDMLFPASIRPFGKWYNTVFPDTPTTFVTYGGIFAVSRQHIHQHPVAYYQRLIQEFPHHSNPEVGHYFERSWVAIFGPIPNSCFYEYRQEPSYFLSTVIAGLCILSLAYLAANATQISRFVHSVYTMARGKKLNGTTVHSAK